MQGREVPVKDVGTRVCKLHDTRNKLTTPLDLLGQSTVGSAERYGTTGYLEVFDASSWGCLLPAITA